MADDEAVGPVEANPAGTPGTPPPGTLSEEEEKKREEEMKKAAQDAAKLAGSDKPVETGPTAGTAQKTSESSGSSAKK